MLLLYVSSTLVHSFPEGKVKDLFEIFDHSAIYIFIAGTYTPIMLLVVKGDARMDITRNRMGSSRRWCCF